MTIAILNLLGMGGGDTRKRVVVKGTLSTIAIVQGRIL